MSKTKTDPNAPAGHVPMRSIQIITDCGVMTERTGGPGLTKREWLAGLAMQGLLTDPAWGSVDIAKAAGCAVANADALIAALNEEEASHGE